MEQKLGKIIENFSNNTYLRVLCSDLRTLLYKYMFIDIPRITVASDEVINNTIRTYNREAALVINNDTNNYYYKFDVNFMKFNNYNIHTFVKNILENNDCTLYINRITFLIFRRMMGLVIFINTVDPMINDALQKTIVNQSKIYLTSNLLEALLSIADMENFTKK